MLKLKNIGIILLSVLCLQMVYAQQYHLLDNLSDKEIGFWLSVQIDELERFPNQYLYIPNYNQSIFEKRYSKHSTFNPIIKNNPNAFRFLQRNGYVFRGYEKGGATKKFRRILSWIYFINETNSIYLVHSFCSIDDLNLIGGGCPFFEGMASNYHYNCETKHWEIESATVQYPSSNKYGLEIRNSSKLQHFFSQNRVKNALCEQSRIANLNPICQNYGIKYVSDTLGRYLYLNNIYKQDVINAYLYNLSDNYIEVDIVLQTAVRSPKKVATYGTQYLMFYKRPKQKVRLKFVYNCAKEIWELEEK